MFVSNWNEKTEITMNKQVYLVQAILDINKTLMYDFYYGYIRPKYADRVKLAYTDTDSLIIQIFTKDFLLMLVLMLMNGLILVAIQTNLLKLELTRKNLEQSKMKLVIMKWLRV